ncbi:class I SAM-dependent methyltransferase [Sphingomonas sp. 1P06PA]|uniref:class I SAM-dependent methyltransferase n=1 Tax=Sphingomonas sp. 1P06PA TaxID=554121 RepID=UPI0039A61AA6
MKHTLLMLALLAAAPLPAQKPSAAISAALADPARPAADKARDAARKPAETLAFAGIKPGDTVADFIMGGGYYTRLLSATVGPTGKVFAFQPDEFIRFMAKYGEDQKGVAAAYANVVPITTNLHDVEFPAPVDAIITVQNYHDLHLKPFPADTADVVNAALFRVLKPGGTLLVIDHAAAAGSGLRDADTLHRIDSAAARAEIEKAGFKFEAETSLLRDPADPHTANVFDPAIRGRTDQFAYRFRKPR